MSLPATASRTWFITGASRGLGHAFALAALERGDQVVAAARTITPQAFGDRYGDRLLALPLDVTDRAAVFAAVDTAVEHFGKLDIVVNNAGTMSSGMVEEFTEARTCVPRVPGTSCRFPASPPWAVSRAPGCTARASSRWRA
jgi:NAD(P)-dependent dehydrogenase (short-subunit alcohol dehydrogenase family)